MVTERCQIAECSGIVEVVKCGMETWSQDQWIEYFADTADGFGGLSTLAVTAKDVQSTGQAIPGSPVLGKFHKSGLKSSAACSGR